MWRGRVGIMNTRARSHVFVSCAKRSGFLGFGIYVLKEGRQMMRADGFRFSRRDGLFTNFISCQVLIGQGDSQGWRPGMYFTQPGPAA